MFLNIKKIDTSFIFLFCAFFALAMLSNCSNHKITEQNQLIIGTCSDFPPYESLDEQGISVGFDIDVAQKLAEKLGKKLVVKDMSFDALILALQQGTIDLILSGMSITKSREEVFALIHYHGKSLTKIPLVFWNTVPDGVQTVSDLKKIPNKTVCAQAGTIQDEIISHYTFLNIKHLDTVADLLMDIKYGGSIAAVLEPDVVASLQKKFPEIKTIDIMLTEQEKTFGHGIGINKKNGHLIAKIQSIIKQLKDDETITKLEHKWFITAGKIS